MRRQLLWLTSLLAGCAGQNWLVSSSNGSTASTGSPSSNTSSRASSDSSAASSGTTRQSDASSSGQSSVISAASVLLVAAGVGITVAIYATQARDRPVRPKKKRVRRERNEPVERAPQEPVLPQPAPLPLPDPGSLPPTPSEPPLPPLDAMVQSRAWLVANELQLKQDLALGAGPSIDDLAGIAGIEPERRAHFGRVLQRHRQELLAPHELTPQQAAAVMARVGALVMGDPLLRIDGEAVLAER